MVESPQVETSAASFELTSPLVKRRRLSQVSFDVDAQIVSIGETAARPSSTTIANLSGVSELESHLQDA
jgi:hypothetical protein